MKEFNFQIPTKVYFGTDITEKALNKESSILGENILIITTGGSLYVHGYIQKLINILKGSTKVKQIFIYDKISSNPKLHEIKEAVNYAKPYDIKMVIGFGGGSAIDAAKAAAVGLGTGDDLEEYLLNGKVPGKRTLPIIAIPTTAGTGSELSKGAIISSLEYHIKSGIRGDALLPKLAIVDCIYTKTIPEHITLETGFDVLAHAIESYVAEKANFWSEMLSEKAIKIAVNSLMKLKEDIKDIEAREQMCFASTIMGMNLAMVGTCLPHRMQYVIGAETDTGHAAGLVALYPAWIKAEYQVNAYKVRQVLEWMGYIGIANAEDAKDATKDFLNKLGVTYSLQTFGISFCQIDKFVNAVTGNLANDRLVNINDSIRKIFEESF